MIRTIKPPLVYIAEDRLTTVKEKKRLERMLGSMNCSPDNIIRGRAEEIEIFLILAGKFDRDEKTGEKNRDDPIIYFSGFDWSRPTNDPNKPAIDEKFSPGRFSFIDYRSQEDLLNEHGIACNSAFELHSAFGCLHKCKYCHIGDVLTIMLDIEKMTDNLEKFIENNPSQKLFKYDNQSDIPTLEPEYGATDHLVKFFANTDRYLMLYTKSNNLNYLPDASVHKNHTIVCWTLSCDDVVNNYEKEAPSLDERLVAARICQDKGYKIRFRFSPIIPIHGWKDAYANMIHKIFVDYRLKPDVISMNMLAHIMKNQGKHLFPNLAFKPKLFVNKFEYFPQRNRSEVYDFFINQVREYDNNVKLALCLETKKMWQTINKLDNKKGGRNENGKKGLEGNARAFYCCCGAKCV